MTVGWQRRAAAAAAAVLFGVLCGPVPARADGVRDRSWHLTQLRIAEAHRVTQGEGVTVAVVDTGVDASHPDLTGSVLPGVDLYDPANRNKGQRDAIGHGTSIASIIAGHGHGPGGRDGVLGIAPKAKILPVNVYEPKSGRTNPDTIGQGIRAAVDRGADIVCVAQGGSFSAVQVDAVKYADARDVLVIAAAGNPPSVFLDSPASVDEAVAVTGFDRSGKSVTTVVGAATNEIDVAAPGAEIQAALPGGRYYAGTGTSAATAIVAGATALIRARYPQARRNEQLRRLVWTTSELGDPGRDFVYGWGGVDPVAALTTEPRVPVSASATPDAPNPTATPRAAPGGISGADRAGLAILGVITLAVLAVVALVIVLLVRLRRRSTAP